MGKVSSRKEIVTNVLETTRQLDSQIGNLVKDYVNLTLNEINDPAWAFPRNNYHHLWSWLRRKTTFDTVASTEDYVMARDIDKISLIRQIESPTKLNQLTDDLFYELVPYPTATGNPRFYRMWSNEGVSTRLAVADTIDVVSSSASDAGDSDISVTVVGYSGGIRVSETYQINGTTVVTGSITFDAREVYVSKQGDTTGNITVTENSGSTTLVVLGKEERNPRFKVLSLYPIPSSAITMYVEYYTYIRELTNDSDVPEFDSKWHYIVRLGTLSKVLQYLGQESQFLATQAQYASGVKAMVASDRTNPDLVETLTRRKFNPAFRVYRSEDEITA